MLYQNSVTVWQEDVLRLRPLHHSLEIPKKYN